ncbi:hypothetical protein Pmani_005837 [Petrolisthes manimaculis]|uniref:Uncharacterized protein n=1 Tax=Petrolisthes manimaculis TaxID=1843537 RepID=A0AAE1QAX8_9EUCA|nr:hypothetical protein Pmani_005837 [Petrolisthes manimaculis]
MPEFKQRRPTPVSVFGGSDGVGVFNVLPASPSWREDDQLRQDSNRSNVGSDGSSSKRYCVNHLAVSQPAVNNVRLRSQATVRLRTCLLRNISLISSPTY